MKKTTFTSILMVLSILALAQVPESFSYQVVVRDGVSNNPLTNQNVSFKMIILKGGTSGTEEYTEYHAANTGALGIVNLVIGNGTGKVGDISTINWGADSYYLKVMIDKTGGEDYVEMGTTQLLSVPYALYAKIAETIAGTITETDPIFTTSQAQNITGADITKLSNLSGTNTGDQDLSGLATTTTVTEGLAFKVDKVTGKGLSTEDYTTDEKTKLGDLTNADGSETKVTAGTNITVTGSGTTADPYVLDATGATTLTIGQSYQGGIIFWLDATGQHGLIAATEDQSAGIQWDNGTNRYTGTTGDGLYSGAMNTAMIIATQMADNQTGNFAAKVCADYSITVGGVTYGDWYLPSKYELSLLYQQKTAVAGVVSDFYWSSTEYNNLDAWVIQFFDNGNLFYIAKSITYGVRAVRAF